MKTILSISVTAIVAFFTAWSLSEDKVQPEPPFNPASSKYVLAQFNASWNSAPDVTGLETIKWCIYHKVDISKNPAAKSKHKITTLPTVIFFKDGVEVKRWEAGIGMKASFTAQQINLEIQRLK
jgi:hypothetical protein